MTCPDELLPFRLLRGHEHAAQGGRPSFWTTYKHRAGSDIEQKTIGSELVQCGVFLTTTSTMGKCFGMEVLCTMGCRCMSASRFLPMFYEEGNILNTVRPT